MAHNLTKKQRKILLILLNKSYATGALDNAIELQDKKEVKERYGCTLAYIEKAYDKLLWALSNPYSKF
jgi:hypothetical protein